MEEEGRSGVDREGRRRREPDLVCGMNT